MKKCLMILVALIGFGISVNAQSCVIKETNDGSTCEVQSCYLSGDNVIVNVINDSKDIAANVTVNVTVTYKYGISTKTKQYSGKDVSIARVPLKIEIPISTTHPEHYSYVADSVVATSISGTKCE